VVSLDVIDRRGQPRVDVVPTEKSTEERIRDLDINAP